MLSLLLLQTSDCQNVICLGPFVRVLGDGLLIMMISLIFTIPSDYICLYGDNYH